MFALWPSSTEVDQSDLERRYAWPSGRWVRSNMISSIDGVAESPDGGTRTLSSDADRRILRIVRSRADAIVVGAATARREGYRALRSNPEAVADREAAGQASAPTLVIVSRSLEFADFDHLFDGGAQRTIVATTSAAADAAKHNLHSRADIIECGSADVEIAKLLGALADRGLVHVVCEGGPGLLGQFVAADAIDDLAVSIAPVVVGGDYDQRAVHRMVSGVALPAHQKLSLQSVVAEESMLFALYQVVR